MSAVVLTAAILFRNGCTVIVGQHMLFIRSRYLVVGAVALFAVGMIALVKIYRDSGKQQLGAFRAVSTERTLG